MKHRRIMVHSWRRWLFMAFPPLAAVLFALALTMPASAASVFNTTVPVSSAISNPCNGEVVTISGNAHETFQVTFDGNGGEHVVATTNFVDVTGTGSFGNTYQIPSAVNSILNARVGSEETLTVATNVISQGSAPNFLLHVVSHMTVNPDGTVTVVFIHISSTCPG